MQRNTREIICQEALHLFSVYGYEGVSTKAIADAVGIKDSSLYNHFKSKRGIFNELQVRYQCIAEKMMHQLESACIYEIKINIESFKSISDIFFEKYLMDDFCNRFLRLMLMEQCNNTEIQHLYTKWMIDMPLQFQNKIFSKLDVFGKLSVDDYEYLALKFYSPIYLFTHRYLLVGELTEEKKNLFRTATNNHVLLFMKDIGGKINV